MVLHFRSPREAVGRQLSGFETSMLLDSIIEAESEFWPRTHIYKRVGTWKVPHDLKARVATCTRILGLGLEGTVH